MSTRFARGKGASRSRTFANTLDRLSPDDRVGLVSLPYGTPRVDVTTDRKAIADALGSIAGSTARRDVDMTPGEATSIAARDTRVRPRARGTRRRSRRPWCPTGAPVRAVGENRTGPPRPAAGRIPVRREQRRKDGDSDEHCGQHQTGDQHAALHADALPELVDHGQPTPAEPGAGRQPSPPIPGPGVLISTSPAGRSARR